MSRTQANVFREMCIWMMQCSVGRSSRLVLGITLSLSEIAQNLYIYWANPNANEICSVGLSDYEAIAAHFWNGKTPGTIYNCASVMKRTLYDSQPLEVSLLRSMVILYAFFFKVIKQYWKTDPHQWRLWRWVIDLIKRHNQQCFENYFTISIEHYSSQLSSFSFLKVKACLCHGCLSDKNQMCGVYSS